MKTLTHTSATFAILCVLAAPPALGCKPLPGTTFATIEQTTQDAPIVVEAIARVYIGKGTYRVQIPKWLKGSGPDEILVTGFGQLEGVQTSCDKNLRTGEKVLLFLAPHSSDLYTISFVSDLGFPAQKLWIERVQPATAMNVDAVRKSADGARR